MSSGDNLRSGQVVGLMISILGRVQPCCYVLGSAVQIALGQESRDEGSGPPPAAWLLGNHSQVLLSAEPQAHGL